MSLRLGPLRGSLCRCDQDYGVSYAYNQLKVLLAHSSLPCRTSHEEHLALLLDCPDARFLVLFFLLRHKYGFFHVSEYKIAMRVVCLRCLVSKHALRHAPIELCLRATYV